MNDKFLTFVNDLVDDDDLRNVIIESYYIIFESKIDVAKEVYREYNKILDNLDKFEPVGNTYKLNGEINGVPFVTYIQFNSTKGTVDAFANVDPMEIIIYSHELFLFFKQNNREAIKKYFTNSYVKYTVAHELTHLYEYTNRDINELSSYIKNIDMKKVRSSHKLYYNQQVEQTPIRIGVAVSMIKDAINNGITDPNKIYSFIIDNMDEWTNNTFKNLSEKNKKQLYKTITTILNKICSNGKCNLKDLA